MKIDWRTALVYVTRERFWKQRIGLGGLLLLVVPPVGWVLALGYRSLVANRLLEGSTPLLPPWRDNVALAFRRGAMSSGVIVAYLTPFLCAYWLLGAGSSEVVRHWREAALFAAAVILFPPLALTALPVLYGAWYGWLHLSSAEISVLVVLFSGGILLLPAGFLQVALHRRFRAAFYLVSALRLVLAAPRLYAEAWLVSLAVSVASVLIVPLAPWLLFWSYLVISHMFLQVLARADRSERAPRHAVQLQQVPT